MTRDSQRQKLYDAERDVAEFEKMHRLESMFEIEAYVRCVTRDAWFVRHYGEHTIQVRDGRGHRRATGNYLLGRITMPTWSRSKMITLHELVHACVRCPRDEGAHGRNFARAYLAVVGHFLGREVGAKLKVAMAAHGVRWKAKRAGTSRGNPEALARWRQAQAAAAAPQAG